jgi:dipeptidyl aminopeptidase/acylaminoacyl peptidase
MTIAPLGDSHRMPEATTSRRSFLSAGVTLGAGAGAVLLMGNISTVRAAEGHQIKEYDVPTNGISLHVTEMGEGEAVVFCHGFPDTAYTWRRQMQAVASAGYRAIAPDMRGYGRSSAPADAAFYTPLQTTGDLIGLLDALKIPAPSSWVMTGERALPGAPRLCGRTASRRCSA